MIKSAVRVATVPRLTVPIAITNQVRALSPWYRLDEIGAFVLWWFGGQIVYAKADTDSNWPSWQQGGAP